jgi:hypothetical protein
MAHKMNLWISEMYHALFNVFPEHLNADYLPPSFKLNQTDGEFHLEPLLSIRGDAMNLSLQLVSDTLHISQTPGRGFCLTIAQAEPSVQSLVGGQVCRTVSHVFSGTVLYGKVFGEFATGTSRLGPDFLQ